MKAAPRDGYWAVTASAARAAAAGDNARAEWEAPLELAIACSSSAIVPVILARAARGEAFDDTSRIFRHAGRLFAVVTAPGREDLVLPLRPELGSWRR